MKKKKHKKARIALIVLFCLVFIPLAALWIVARAVLPPEKLTPLVVKTANEYLDADLQCEKIELTYFETFPHLGIAFTRGKLISHVAEDSTAVSEAGHASPTDSLVTFDRCVVSLHPTELLFNKRLLIKKIILIRPSIYGYVNEAGKTNWEIYQPADSLAAADSAQAEPPMPVEIGRIRIKDATLTFDDRQSGLYTRLEGFYFSSDGSFASAGHTRSIRTGWKSLRFESLDYTLENELEFQLQSRIRLSDNFRRLHLSDTEMQINRLPFTLNGSIAADSVNKCLDMDLEYGLDVPDLNTLLAFVPSAYMKNDNRSKITGSVRLTGTVRGALGENVYPVVNACCILENGSLHGESEESGIDSLALDIDLRLDRAHNDSSYIELARMYLQGKHCSFDMQGKATRLLDNPEITATVKGDIDFTEISKNFFRSDTLTMGGTIRTDLYTHFRMNDLARSDFGKIIAQGQLDVRDFKAISDPYDVSLLVTRALFQVDSETRSEKFLKDRKLMTTRLAIDSLNIRWKDKIVTTLAGMDLALSAPPTADTTAIVPMAGTIRFNRLRTLLPDSVWLWAGKTEMKGGIKASSSDKKIPVAAAIVRSDSLAYLYPQYHTGLLLLNSSFNISAFPYKTDTTARRRPALTAARRDSLRRRMLARRDTTLMLDKSTSSLLRKWDVKGNVVFNDMKAFTPFFPVRIAMQGSNVHFTTDEIKLSGARLLLGKTDLTLNGEINNLRRMWLRGGKFTANLSVTSDYIDCNELMNALSRGMLYSDQQAAVSEADMATEKFSDFQESADRIAGATEAPDTSGVFVVPKFLDLTLQTQAKKIDFNDLDLENVRGKVVLRDQSIQLTDLDMHSNIGSGHLTMIYSAENEKSASAGFDLEMEKIQVDKLIGLFPSMDTLVPMLRSFEGIVDCQLAATCRLDSSMSVELPSLYSACHLHGTDMVLLDGETFAEISKKLMFKNKKRNMIDQIAVDLVVKDNKIEVFPFLVEMDRYRVAVGGTHNLDMSFNYHISVLKSPVPFKLGINITGTLDHFKFGIGKCKYKDLFKPAKSSVLDSTNVRINVREDIYNAIRQQLQAALLSPDGTPPGNLLLTERPALAQNTVGAADSTDTAGMPDEPSEPAASPDPGANDDVPGTPAENTPEKTDPDKKTPEKPVSQNNVPASGYNLHNGYNDYDGQNGPDGQDGQDGRMKRAGRNERKEWSGQLQAV